MFYLTSDLTFLKLVQNTDFRRRTIRTRAYKYFVFPNRRLIAGLLILKRLIYSADRFGIVFTDESCEIKYPLVKCKLSSIGLFNANANLYNASLSSRIIKELER